MSEDTTLNLPPGWTRITVGDAGITISGAAKRPASSDDFVAPYLRVANVRDDYLDLSDVSTMPIPTPDKHLLVSGDVLVCGSSGSASLVGRSAMYEGQLREVYFQNHILRFRSSEAVDPHFALLVFRAYQRSGAFANVAQGTTGLMNLGLRRFREMPFPLPPKHLQHELVRRSRALQDIVDITRETLSTSQELLPTLNSSIIDSVILRSGALEPLEATPLPAGWVWSTAQDQVADDSPIVYGILQPGPHEPDGIPYVRGKDLQQGEILTDQLRRTSPEIAEKHARSSLQGGDVLLGIIRSTRVAVVPPSLRGANVTQGTARLRPREGMSSEYLASWISGRSAQHWLRSRMRGIDMPGLNLADVRQLPIPVPPASSQKRMADHLASVERDAAILSRKTAAALLALEGFETAFLVAVTKTSQLLPAQVHGNGGTQHGSFTSLPAVADLMSKEDGTRLIDVDSRGVAAATPNDLLNALGVLNDASPEDLFAELGLSEDGVDSFYIAFRELMTSGRIELITNGDTRTVVRT